MGNISCSCTINKGLTGVGELTAKISTSNSLRNSFSAVGKLTSPVKDWYKHITDELDISSYVGSGPLYDITLDQSLPYLSPGDKAVINHYGKVNPNLSLFSVGGEALWFSPKDDDKDSDTSDNFDNLSKAVHVGNDENNKSYFTSILNNGERGSDGSLGIIEGSIKSGFSISKIDATLSTLSEWSLSSWVYVDKSYKYNSNISNDGYVFAIGGARVSFFPTYSDSDVQHRLLISQVFDGSSISQQVNISRSINGWIHLNVERVLINGNYYIAVYINNSLYTSISTNGSEVIGGNFYIYYNGIYDRSLYKFDDFRFFNSTITQSQRDALYNYRALTERLNTYEYEVYETSNDVITIEYVTGNNGDVPLSDLCEEIVNTSDDDCSDDTIDCNFNAKISFEYFTELPHITYVKTINDTIEGVGEINSNLSADIKTATEIDGVGEIRSKTTACLFPRQYFNGSSNIISSYIDKYIGDKPSFEASQKLYPIADDVVDGFVNSNYNDNDLYSFIDEGVYAENYPDSGYILSDNITSFIQPSSVNTNGIFFYKCEVTKPLIIPEKSVASFRISAPLKTYTSHIPPRYTISGVLLEDKYGNPIVEYEDITFLGDANRNDQKLKHNFTTAFLGEKRNFAALNEWDRRGAPKLNEDDGYKFSFFITAEDLGAAFTEGFNFGFEENKQIDTFIGIPSQSINISAIELSNSGNKVNSSEDYLPIFYNVPSTGIRLQKCFFPTEFLLDNFQTTIEPDLTSKWQDESYVYDNSNKQNLPILLEKIKNEYTNQYVTTKDVQDSGKLILKFGHNSRKNSSEITDGAFGGDFHQNLFGNYFTPSGSFNTLNELEVETNNSFAVIESIKLRVLAKKTSGTDDYVFDVVGYSDDCLLNITSKKCGFLQNVSGVTISDPVNDTTSVYSNQGSLPVESGFNSIDDLGISIETLSDKNQYFEKQGCDDHNKLTTYPVVSSTEFQWYEIPLEINEPNVELGKITNYKNSSFLEKLYLDIYPLPSGASIASVHLCVTYAPQDGLNLISQGGERIGQIPDGRSEGSYYPISRQSNDSILNAGSGYEQISKIENIPHAYTTPNTIKTNYARRWRGMIGLTQGPFDVNQFDFGFDNPLLETPLVDGYFDFNNVNGNSITSRDNGFRSQSTGSFSRIGDAGYQMEVYKNIGYRLSSGTLFNNLLPGYSGDYLTADWTALSSGSANFENHELYGKISDAYDNVVRLSSGDSIQINDFNASQGFSLFARFIPDANVSGSSHNLYSHSAIFSVQDTPISTGVFFGFVDGLLTASGNGVLIQDTTPYSGYQYPLSTLLTYNAHHDKKMRIYTDNELYKGSFENLRATSSAVDILSDDDDLLYVGYGQDSVSGLPMLLSEFGFSKPIAESGTNIVQDNADRNLKEITAEEFFNNHRMKFFDPSESHSEDNYKFWDYVNENTYTDWAIGDFKYCSFSTAFSIMQKRTGRDLINLHIENDGLPYFSKTNLDFPTSVNSGVSYHTQIENDFLRFHLSDTADNFYSVNKRISKNLPFGYKFAEKALVVETVLEHKTFNDIVWSDGNVGPKLIVSLYTPKKDKYYNTDGNLGLINRDIHYLQPSSCFIRLDSKFTYDSVCDESEQWSIFPNESRLQEFEHKYYSQDVDDMYLQYDIVFPSGQAYKSDLYIHSAHVRAEDAFVQATDNSGVFNLYASGNPSPVDENFNLITASYSGIQESGFSLYTVGPLLAENSGLLMFSSGDFISRQRLNVFLHGYDEIKDSGFNLLASGDGRVYTNNSDSFQLFTYGKDYSSGIFPLSVINTYETHVPEPSTLNLFAFATENSGIRNIFNLNVLHDFGGGAGLEGAYNTSMPLSVLSYSTLSSRYENERVNLTVYNVTPDSETENLNLTLYGDNLSEVVSSSSLNISLMNYSAMGGSSHIFWYNNNYGEGIELADETFVSLDPNDEIRGVDLFGYGSCTGNSPDKAIDEAVITDGIVWREETCNDGGIFRATSTYTNLEVGYSGDYYGIRKYTGLIKNHPYYATLTIKTGSTESIPVPRDWEEWGYGTCGPDTIGDCCPDDCTQNINFSGVKLISDIGLSEPSGRLSNDNYGNVVSVNKDLMAVGSPKHSIVDEENNVIENAGSIYLYRRNEDIAGLKASWELEDVLTLPSGYKKDYISSTIENLICYPSNANPEFCISGQKWNIGQEGRQLGYSLDIAYSGDKQVVVAGAPTAAWSRDFDVLNTSGVPVGLLVFTDKFTFNNDKLSLIHNAASKYDILYKYFSATWDLPTGSFQPKLDIKVLLCHVHDSDQIDDILATQRTMNSLQEDWFKYTPINSLLDKDRSEQELLNEAVSGIKQSFFELFPYKNSLYSGIPPIVGVFGDDTFSTSNTYSYKAAMDEFLDFYQSYAYESGVQNLETEQPESGYVNKIFSDSFTWNQACVELLKETLSTGNLIEQNVLHYVSSGVGQEHAQSNAYEFQIPPASGGRVYIFEKEGDTFNFIQELISPDEDLFNQAFDENDYSGDYGTDYIQYSKKPNDRFGHSVSISNNGNIIAVGSPFSKEACRIYQLDESENTRMYNGISGWLNYNNMTTEQGRYATLASASGLDIAKSTVYQELSQSNKYRFRSDENYWGDGNTITPYKKVYSYHYNDIDYTGTWSFIVNEFAGTSRLGYSSAVNEDGTTVIFGAPTDSFNEFEDINVWGEQEDTWASYVNAGAIRVFESREYNPHRKAVEFTKFGNIDRSVHATGDMSQYYNQMGLYFSPDNIPFERTSFDEIEIPEDAGLAFIITPEIDAASDEIIDNIKSWLALGDRTLVLVGNDPVWEENGLYKKSNDIINKILKKLDCRMRIVPARNEQESLQGCISEEDVQNDKFNIIKSFVPDYSHDTHIVTPSLFAKGIADIKIDLSDLNLEDLYIKSPCDDLNTKCELPIKHYGDLRAQWNSECVVIGDPSFKIEYKTNLPFHFDNVNPAQSCSFYPEIVKPYINRPNEDVRPLLVGAEYTDQIEITIPSSTSSYEECETIFVGNEIKVIEGGSYKTYAFAENQEDKVKFSISQASNSSITGIYNEFIRGGFFDPDKTNGRDAFMQAAGSSYQIEVKPKTRIISQESVIAAEETYYAGSSPTTSKVFIMASMLPETDWSLGKLTVGDDVDYRTNNNDQNILFYNNLVMKSCDIAGDIVQLGGWTGRTSFRDAFSDSRLKKVLLQYGHAVEENVTYLSNEEIKVKSNVVWIANPSQKPSDRDIQRIKTWLNTGSKKLVITYSNDQSIAENVTYICEQLNINTKPFYLNGESKYFVQDSEVLTFSNAEQCCPYSTLGEDPVQLVDSENNVIKGCSGGYTFNNINTNTKVEKLAIIPNSVDPATYYAYEIDQETGYSDYAYIPLNVSSSASKVIYFNDPIRETYWENPYDFWKIDGDCNIKFPVEAGSGYRLFVNWVSESQDEKYRIKLSMNDVSLSPDPEGYSLDSPERYLDKTILYTPQTSIVDFRVPENKEEFTLNFNTKEWRRIASEDLDGARPITPRILSISGCLLPIDVSTIVTADKTRTIPVYDTVCETVTVTVPEKKIVIPPEFRAISTLNDKYCQDGNTCDGYNGQLIEDGPVVAAEELEHFTSFTAGRNRSRIVLITDSTIVQGQCPHYRNDALSENQLFIRSLYPTSPEKYSDTQFNEANFALGEATSKFNFVQKIRSPERGSAAKYFAVSGITDLADRYGFNGVNDNLENYTDQEDTFVPGDVYRRFTPITKIERDQEIENFSTDSIAKYGVYPRYSGVFGGEVYLDAPIQGGITRLMEETGNDYLDWDVINSGGFPGDLFGYSVDIHDNKIVVGSPFNAFKGEDLVSWSGVIESSGDGNIGSGLQISRFGGPGSAYYYERTERGTNAVSEFLPWEFKQKIKTDTVNVGLINPTSGNLTAEKGNHNLDDSFVEQYGEYTDRFGYSVAIDYDFIAVGAPAHDFETIHEHIYSGDSAFIRKEFSSEFDIPKHNFYDLGSSGNRADLSGSGTMVLNNGAVFTFRHNMTDWNNREKTWEFSEKLNAQGYSDRNSGLSSVSGTENDFFGYSVSINRANRGDSDYTLAVGSPGHNYATSGDHSTQTLENAGAAYSYDAMLRQQAPSIPNSGSYIDAQVFGSKPSNKLDRLINTVYQNTSGDSLTYQVSGIIFSNENGDVFLEVSGYDPSPKGFVLHRPYVESVIGERLDGTVNDNNLVLLTSGKPVDLASSMNLMLSGDPSAIVYNNVDLNIAGIIGNSSGIMPMTVEVASGYSNEYLDLIVGVGVKSENLNLRIRGK